MSSVSPATALRSEKRFRAISYTLVFLMMACVALTISVLIRNLLPDWHAGIIAGILIFLVVDRLYTYRQLKALTPGSREWALNIGAQWLVLVLFSRFLLSYAKGPDALVADLSLLVRGYIADLLTGELVITLLLAFAAWHLTAQFLELLDEIGLDMRLALSEETPRIQSDIIPAHQRMVSLIFTTGVVLVILTALTRLNLRTIAANTSGMPSVEVSRFSGAEAGALLYFVFGLALLSLSRLMSLQTHWNRLRIPVSSSNLPRQWAVYSLVFLLILAVAVSLLPAGDSLGFFSIVGTLFVFLLQVFLFLSQLIVGLILLLVSLPFLLFGKPPPFIMGSSPPPTPVLPTQPILPATSSALWELIRSILLWAGLAAILVFAIRRFLMQHGGLLAALRKSRMTNWLLLAWQWLYRNVDQARVNLADAIADGWQSLVSRWDGKGALTRPGWIRLRSLDPRRRIYFFYLAMIRRGSEQGLPRHPAQTPAEYASKLDDAIPTAREDIDAITQAFVEARYSRQDVEPQKADLVKATWERIRRALQLKAKNAKESNRK